MARKINLFRVSLASDDETTLDRIDFNNPANADLKDAKKENAWITSVERISGQGVGDDQPAEEALGSKDATGPVDDTYIITGKITRTSGDLDDGVNQFLLHLDLWDAESKTVGGVEWGEGRFGIIDDNDHTNDLIPVRTGTDQIGLIWESYTKKSILATNQTEFIIRLTVSRGDGT
ncbi:MAG: hypothetical protein KC444_09260 [Nitrosopumilus sp.]|nr:hypothetical protein [Nitrosopumilus sp.]